MKIMSVFRHLFLGISPLVFKRRNAHVAFTEKLQMNINSCNEKKTFICNYWFNRQCFSGYLCKSSIAIFACMVTWNYAVPLRCGKIDNARDNTSLILQNRRISILHDGWWLGKGLLCSSGLMFKQIYSGIQEMTKTHS